MTLVLSSASCYLRCFLRAYLVGANFNTRGLQNVGLAFAMDPGLRALYPDPGDLRRARKRHFRLYNTHPYWTPFLIGYFLFLERKIAGGTLPPKSLGQIRQTTTYTLSAIGDSVFGGSLLVFWSLSTMGLVLAGQRGLALAWLVLFVASVQVFKALTFWQGLTRGLSFLQRIRRWDLINWGERIKLVNALLLVLLWWRFAPGRATPLAFLAWTMGLTAAAWVAERRRLLREGLAVIVLAGCLFWSTLTSLLDKVAF